LIIIKIAASFIVISLFSFQTRAQTSFTLAGSVVDSIGTPVTSATVRIVTSGDTLFSRTNDFGKFGFAKLASEHFRVLIEGAGYNEATLDIHVEGASNAHVLKPIVLKRTELHLLKEVTIRAKKSPIIFRQDTVEFDVGSFAPAPDDLLEDLLRRLPGITFDTDGNTLYMGKKLNKLRVNGKDFFSGEVSAFLKQLPAEILSKLQVIDDYGDEANFTGVKAGEPVKMLNLVTKPGINSGTFGNAATNFGTNKQLGFLASANYWMGTKQMSAGLVNSKADNNIGKIKTNSATISYKDDIKKDISVSGDYGFNGATNSVEINSLSQSVINSANIYSELNNRTSVSTNRHVAKFDVQYRPSQKNFLSISSILGLTSTETENRLSSFQTGSIHQDLFQADRITAFLPSISGSATFRHHFSKPGRNIAVSYRLAGNQSTVKNYSLDSIVYFGNSFRIDSILNRMINNNTKETSYNGKIVYTEPLSIRSNVDVTVGVDKKIQVNNYTTTNLSSGDSHKIIDASSNIYNNTFTSFIVNVAYRYNNKKLRIIAGANFQPTTLIGYDSRISNTKPLKVANDYLSPVVNFFYLLSTKSTLTLTYTSNSMPPTYDQLNPVKNSENVQNQTVGNPELKPSFTEQVNIDFGHSSTNGGTFNLTWGLNRVKNKIVTNTILVPDLLNSVKQETHFLNANGTYSLRGGYFLSIPLLALDSQKYNLNLTGNVSIDKNKYYTNNVFAKATNLMADQSLNFNFAVKRFGLGATAIYNLNTNRVSDGAGINTSFKSIHFAVDCNYTITRNLKINVNTAKTFNSGIQNSLSKNPFIVNVTLKQTLFKKKAGSIELQAFDLLNQSNSLIRTVTANSITDSRLNYVTRYFKLTLAVRLSKFGRKK
jgi:hypothetical protein